eukprot:TRINITY_DN3719_c0_g1_i1.p1 TRINITY_DN3719_c0_g1~~TRINITY_DN3719_c0_g1_i1.p1  ORF type:complete len:591 (+),score=117.83 TRINITY_DN3719_c0_g1_i1:67-1839(+)
MGQVVSSGNPVSESFATYLSWDIPSCKKLLKKFYKIQSSFGWGVDKALFQELFSLEDATQSFDLWDTDRNGRVDVLEILCGMILCANATFANKLAASFELFDFDENGWMSKDELVIFCKTCVKALSKICGMEETDSTLDYLTPVINEMFSQADKQSRRKLTKDEIVAWAAKSPSAVSMLCRYGTTDAVKYLKVINRNAQVVGPVNWQDEFKLRVRQARASAAATTIQRQYRRYNPLKGEPASANPRGASPAPALSASPSTASLAPPNSGDSGETASEGESMEDVSKKLRRVRHRTNVPTKYTLSETLQLKQLFEKMDTDHSGKVSIREMAKKYSHLSSQDVASLFNSIDIDSSGSVTFYEMLKVMYPFSSEAELTQMYHWAYPKEISREQVQTLCAIFDDLDTDLDGKVRFHEFLYRAFNQLRDDSNSRHIVEALEKAFAKDEFVLQGSMTMEQVLTELFARSQGAYRMKVLLSHINLPPPLPPPRQTYLESLFLKYLRIQYGDVVMDEKNSTEFLSLSRDGLVQAMAEIGLEPENVHQTFALMDLDNSGTVSVLEFKRFYRQANGSRPGVSRSMTYSYQMDRPETPDTP